jgi:hypothetical protein
VKEEKELRLKMAERRAVVKATARRYQRGRKKEKQKILDEFTELTGEDNQLKLSCHVETSRNTSID